MARVKNWGKFQHYKDRKPEWIKLYRDLLDDLEWHKLDAEASKALVMLWLIASETDGQLPDSEVLAFRLRKTKTQVESILSKLSHWLVQDASNPLAEAEHLASLDKEKEKEKERGTELPEWVDTTAWTDWENYRKEIREPITNTARKNHLSLLEKYKSQQRQIITTSISAGWRGLFPPKAGDAKSADPFAGAK